MDQALLRQYEMGFVNCPVLYSWFVNCGSKLGMDDRPAEPREAA